MQHTCKTDRTEVAVREVVDRLDTNGPRYAALGSYDKFVVASAAAVALGVNVNSNASVPDAAQALLYEAHQIIQIVCAGTTPSEAAALDRLLVVVADIVDDGPEPSTLLTGSHD